MKSNTEIEIELEDFQFRTCLQKRHQSRERKMSLEQRISPVEQEPVLKRDSVDVGVGVGNGGISFSKNAQICFGDNLICPTMSLINSLVERRLV